MVKRNVDEINLRIKQLKAELRDTAEEAQKRRILTKLGNQYEAKGAYWRARHNYAKADDREAIAKSYEAQGNLKKAEEEWYRLAVSSNTTSPERRIYLNENVIRVAELYGQATGDQILATIGLNQAKEEIRFNKLSSEEKKKIFDRKKKKSLEESVDSGDHRSYDYYNIVSPIRSGNFLFFIGILTILGGLFFLYPNMTGNAIAGSSIQNSSILGACLLIVGLVTGLFWMKNK